MRLCTKSRVLITLMQDGNCGKREQILTVEIIEQNISPLDSFGSFHARGRKLLFDGSQIRLTQLCFRSERSETVR